MIFFYLIKELFIREKILLRKHGPIRKLFLKSVEIIILKSDEGL